MPASRNRTLTLVIALVVVIVLYMLLTMPDRRPLNERVGDAIGRLDEGPDKAARELEKRTPGERLGDAVKDAGQDIKRDLAPRNQ